ncbi:MAG: hypothetical protein ACTHKV_00345 [Flavipsychrobacter sp.]
MRKTYFVLIACFLLMGVQRTHAQDNVAEIRLIEDTLVNISDSMYGAVIPDERAIYNERFIKLLVRALKYPGSYKYGFDSLAQRINIIYPDDKSFRIFNWGIATDEISRRYYGAIQMNAEELKLYPLIDCTAELGKGAEDSILTKGKWYGALYYRIIPHESDGVMYYTMFGLNASNPLTNRKIMDPMSFTDHGVVFGAPLFNIRSQNNPAERINRFILEYKKAVQVSMNWDAELGAVYFDKLASESNDPNRKYTFVPTGEYDGFKWNDGHWDYVQNLIPLDVLKDGDAPAPQPYKGR